MEVGAVIIKILNLLNMVEAGKKGMMENKEIQKHLKTIQKIEKDPALVQPAAICEELIEKYMVTYHKEERIFDRDDMKTWELTHLELSYKSKL